MQVSCFVKYVLSLLILPRRSHSLVYPLSSEVNGSIAQWESKTKTIAQIISGYEGCYEMDKESLNDFLFERKGLTFGLCIQFCKTKQTLFAVAKMAKRACYCKNSIDEMERTENQECQPCGTKGHNCHTNTTFMAFHTKQHTGITTKEPIMIFTEGNMPERDGNLCMTQPCLHGGVCDDIKTTFSVSFRCRCTSGYQGHTCQYRIAHCFHGLCHEGECMSTPSGPICRCLRGTGGHHCQIDTRSHEKLKAANRMLAMYSILFGSIAGVVVIVGFVLSIHCCRVTSRRNRQASRFKRLLKMGMDPAILSKSYPPGVLSTSNQLCREFFCPKSSKVPDIYKDDLAQNILDDFDENTDLPAEEKGKILIKMSERLEETKPPRTVKWSEKKVEIRKQKSQTLERVKSSNVMPVVKEPSPSKVPLIHTFPKDVEQEIFDKVRSQRVLRQFKTFRETETRNMSSQSRPPDDDESGEPLITGEETPDQLERINLLKFFKKRRETREQIFQERNTASQKLDLEAVRDVQLVAHSTGDTQRYDLQNPNIETVQEVQSLGHSYNDRQTNYSQKSNLEPMYEVQSQAHASNDKRINYSQKSNLEAEHEVQSLGHSSNDRQRYDPQNKSETEYAVMSLGHSLPNTRQRDYSQTSDTETILNFQQLSQSLSNAKQRDYSQTSDLETVPKVEFVGQSVSNDRQRNYSQSSDLETVHGVQPLDRSLSSDSKRFGSQVDVESRAAQLVEQNEIVERVNSNKAVHLLKQPSPSPSRFPIIHPFPKEVEQEMFDKIRARQVLRQFKTFREIENRDVTSQLRSPGDEDESGEPLITGQETPDEVERQRLLKFFKQRRESREQIFQDRNQASREKSGLETVHEMELLGDSSNERQTYDQQNTPDIVSGSHPLSNARQRNYSQTSDNETVLNVQTLGHSLTNARQRNHSQTSDKETVLNVQTLGHSLTNARQRNYSQMSDKETVLNVQTLGHSLTNARQRDFSQTSDIDTVHGAGSMDHSLTGDAQRDGSRVPVERSQTPLNVASDQSDEIPTRVFCKLLHEHANPESFSYKRVNQHARSAKGVPVRSSIERTDTSRSFSTPSRSVPGTSGQTIFAPGSSNPTPFVPGSCGPSPSVPASSHPVMLLPGSSDPTQCVPGSSGPSPSVPASSHPVLLLPDSSGTSPVVTGSRNHSPYVYGSVNPSPFVPGSNSQSIFVPGCNVLHPFVPGSTGPSNPSVCMPGFSGTNQFVPGYSNQSPFVFTNQGPRVPGSSGQTPFVPDFSGQTPIIPGSSGQTPIVPSSSNPSPVVPGYRNYNPFVYGPVNHSNPIQVVPGFSDQTSFVPGSSGQSPFVHGPSNPSLFIPDSSGPVQFVPGSSNQSPFLFGFTNPGPRVPGHNYQTQIVPGSSGQTQSVPGSVGQTQVVPGFSDPAPLIPCSSNPSPVIPGSRNHSPFVYGPINPSPFIPGPVNRSLFVPGRGNPSPGSYNNVNHNSPPFWASEIHSQSINPTLANHEQSTDMTSANASRMSFELPSNTDVSRHSVAVYTIDEQGGDASRNKLLTVHASNGNLLRRTVTSSDVPFPLDSTSPRDVDWHVGTASLRQNVTPKASASKTNQEIIGETLPSPPEEPTGVRKMVISKVTHRLDDVMT